MKFCVPHVQGSDWSVEEYTCEHASSIEGYWILLHKS